jgi:hypothetical protein
MQFGRLAQANSRLLRRYLIERARRLMRHRVSRNRS